jgi:hypothetical protein
MSKLVIAILDDDGEKMWSAEYAQFSYTQERGMTIIHDPDNPGAPSSVAPNGQRRGIFKWWEGCEDYESFVHKSEITK